MKKLFLFFLVLSSGFFLSGCSLSKNQGTPSPAAEPTAVPTKPIEETILIRPYVSLVPTADGHWVNLEVKKLPQGTKSIGYELTYFADIEGSKIERGVGNIDQPIDLNGATDFSKKILFGTASCTTGTCKYRYDENITEGVLSLSLIGSSKDKYESSYRLQRGKEVKEGLTTGDGIFSFTSQTLSSGTYLTISTIGINVDLPVNLKAKSLPYGTFPLPGKGNVSFKSGTTASIYCLNGSSWSKLVSEAANGTISAFGSCSTFILAE